MVDPLWTSRYCSVYTDPSLLDIPWYAILGTCSWPPLPPPLPPFLRPFPHTLVFVDPFLNHSLSHIVLPSVLHTPSLTGNHDYYSGWVREMEGGRNGEGERGLC